MARVSATQERRTLPSPYVEFDRGAWSRLRENHPLNLDRATSPGCAASATGSTSTRSRRSTSRSRGCSTSTSGPPGLHAATSDFLGERPASAPFVIGVAGSVAVGKSTTSRILREMLGRWPDTPRVALVTTDGFLLPNAELERRDCCSARVFPSPTTGAR